MVGSYQMVTHEGVQFDVTVPASRSMRPAASPG